MPDQDGPGATGRAVGPWLATAGRLVLGGVLVVAGAVKIPDPAAAVRAVRAYQLLPEPLVAPMAFGLPVVEMAVGLALLAGVFVRTAALSAAVLLLVFMAGVASAWGRGLQIDCGCFGGGGRVSAADTAYPGELLRDLGLLVIAMLLARWPRSRVAFGAGTTTDPRPDDAASPAAPSTQEKSHAR